MLQNPHNMVCKIFKIHHTVQTFIINGLILPMLSVCVCVFAFYYGLFLPAGCGRHWGLAAFTTTGRRAGLAPVGLIQTSFTAPYVCVCVLCYADADSNWKLDLSYLVMLLLLCATNGSMHFLPPSLVEQGKNLCPCVCLCLRASSSRSGALYSYAVLHVLSNGPGYHHFG